ncbi:hypothetical protein MSG28_011360 [Choristoneura fumiferana]|uniref:Uncharacterized protein n=1 Tax=Choristoneura fumiferana TaxID=7141 RepID=A0ACC0JN69_CHOFU|nr:hypothetical protein MSG28_011360 [Choristoneura fumiferana]
MFSPFVKQSWAVSGVLLNMLGQGMVLSFPSVLLPALKMPGAAIHTDLETSSWLSSLVGLASIPGFLASSFLMEICGRRLAHALLIVPGTLGWLLIYFATGIPMLMVGRILGRHQRRLHRHPRRRRHRRIHQPTTTRHVPKSQDSSESPAWLAARQKFSQSEKAWLWLRGDAADAQTEFDSMIRAQKERHAAESTEKSSIKKSVLDFMRKFTMKDFLKPLLIIFLAGILLETCGRHIFPAYALQIIEGITGDTSQSFYYTLIIDIITTVSSTFSSVLVRMLKRRTLLFISGAAALVVLSGVCTCLYLASIDVISKDRAWLPISMLMLYFILANLGCTPIPLALLGEVFPVAHRGAGSAMSGLALSLCLMVALKITPALLESVKVYGTFAIFGSAMAASLVGLYFTLPETKDRTLQEIEDYFNHGRFIDEKPRHDDEENLKMLKS